MTVLDAIIELRRATARAAAATFSGDISAKQAAVLRELRGSGPTSQIALARSTASDPAFLGRLLDDLERRGLIRRKRSHADRREMAVSLTPRGMEALGPLDASLQKLADAAQAELTEDERRVFIELATKVARSLGGVRDGAGADEGAP